MKPKWRVYRIREWSGLEGTVEILSDLMQPKHWEPKQNSGLFLSSELCGIRDSWQEEMQEEMSVLQGNSEMLQICWV